MTTQLQPLNSIEREQAMQQLWHPAVRRLLEFHDAAQAGGATSEPGSAPALAAAPAAPALALPVISLGQLRQLCGLTVAQLAGALKLDAARVADLESLDIELLDVDNLITYCSALGMPLTITVDLSPGAPRDLISTRGKVTADQREQTFAALSKPPSSAEQLGLPDAEQLQEAGAGVHDTQPPAPGELPRQLDTIDAEYDDGDPVARFESDSEPPRQSDVSELDRMG
jgi:transcriptional regulator with XRE-family HTH domain